MVLGIAIGGSGWGRDRQTGAFFTNVFRREDGRFALMAVARPKGKLLESLSSVPIGASNGCFCLTGDGEWPERGVDYDRSWEFKSSTNPRELHEMNAGFLETVLQLWWMLERNRSVELGFSLQPELDIIERPL